MCIRDSNGTEVPRAFVVRTPGAALDESDVIDFVAAHVAPYKKVRVVDFVDEIPRSAAGKILRTTLRDLPRASTFPGPPQCPGAE